jgi:hypothetical protein
MRCFHSFVCSERRTSSLQARCLKMIMWRVSAIMYEQRFECNFVQIKGGACTGFELSPKFIIPI